MHSYNYTPGNYRATCVFVHDACLADFFVDLGFNNYTIMRIKLTGICCDYDARTKGERIRADAAKKYAIEMLRPPSIRDMVSLAYWPCELRNVKPDALDATVWCGEVWVFNGINSDKPTCLNMALIRSELVEEDVP